MSDPSEPLVTTRSSKSSFVPLGGSSCATFISSSILYMFWTERAFRMLRSCTLRLTAMASTALLPAVKVWVVLDVVEVVDVKDDVVEKLLDRGT